MPLPPEFWEDPLPKSKRCCRGCVYDIGGNCTADLRLVKCSLELSEADKERLYAVVRAAMHPSLHFAPNVPLEIVEHEVLAMPEPGPLMILQACLRPATQVMTEADYQDMQWAAESAREEGQ